MPIPGLEVVADITNFGFTTNCVQEFGLTDEALDEAKDYLARKVWKVWWKVPKKQLLRKPNVRENIYKFLQQEGIIELLKKVADSEACNI